MRIKTLVALLVLPLAAGFAPASVTAAPAAPVGDSALVAGAGAVHQAPVVVVERGRRGRYYGRSRTRVVRRVYYRNGRRVIVTRRVRY